MATASDLVDPIVRGFAWGFSVRLVDRLEKTAFSYEGFRPKVSLFSLAKEQPPLDYAVSPQVQIVGNDLRFALGDDETKDLPLGLDSYTVSLEELATGNHWLILFGRLSVLPGAAP
jgi:hypothetical protein